MTVGRTVLDMLTKTAKRLDFLNINTWRIPKSRTTVTERTSAVQIFVNLSMNHRLSTYRLSTFVRWEFMKSHPTNSRNIPKIHVWSPLCTNNSLSLVRLRVPANLRRALASRGGVPIAPTVCRLARAGRWQMNASRNLLHFMTQFPLTTSQINHSFSTNGGISDHNLQRQNLGMTKLRIACHCWPNIPNVLADALK